MQDDLEYNGFQLIRRWGQEINGDTLYCHIDVSGDVEGNAIQFKISALFTGDFVEFKVNDSDPYVSIKRVTLEEAQRRINENDFADKQKYEKVYRHNHPSIS